MAQIIRGEYLNPVVKQDHPHEGFKDTHCIKWHILLTPVATANLNSIGRNLWMPT